MWMEEAFKDTKFKFPGKLSPEAFRQYIDSGQYVARVLEEDMFVNRSGKNCVKKVILVVVEDGGDKYFIQIDIILTQTGPEEYEITVHNVSEMKSLDLFDDLKIGPDKPLITQDFVILAVDESGGATTLPLFEKGTMYKGMEVNKEYTLKYLGL